MDARGYENYSRPAVGGSFTTKVRLINKQRGLALNQFFAETRLMTCHCLDDFKTRDKQQLQQLHVKNPHRFRSIRYRNSIEILMKY